MSKKQESCKCYFHCVHIILFLCAASIPMLVLDNMNAEDTFAYWENRRFDVKDMFEPLSPYCQSAVESIIENKPPETTFDPVELVVKFIDKPWWYNQTTGPDHYCSRLFVMYWDMFGFPDQNDTLGIAEEMDCGQEEDDPVVCGGRMVSGNMEQFSNFGGFPLIWDITLISAQVESQNMDFYRAANYLLFLFPITMVFCSIYYLCTHKVAHFVYVYTACWTLYLSLLLFPFPSFVITKVDTGYSKNVNDYRDHVIIVSDSAISDYAQFAQWIINVLWHIGSIITYQYPATVTVGSMAIYISFVNSLQAIGEKRFHLISTLLEIGLTGGIGCSLITVVSILSTFRPSFEKSLDERLWHFWDLIFPDPFVDTLVVTFYCCAFLFLYLNFLFERLRYWYGKKIFFFLRIVCIVFAIACFVIPGVYLKIPLVLPELPYFVAVIALFWLYNFIVGRFIFFMFFRPELIDDPNFGWYKISMRGCKLHVDRCFDASAQIIAMEASEFSIKDKPIEKAGLVEMYKIESSKSDISERKERLYGSLHEGNPSFVDVYEKVNTMNEKQKSAMEVKEQGGEKFSSIPSVVSVDGTITRGVSALDIEPEGAGEKTQKGTQKRKEAIMDMFTPEVPDEDFYVQRSAEQRSRLKSLWKETSDTMEKQESEI